MYLRPYVIYAVVPSESGSYTAHQVYQSFQGLTVTKCKANIRMDHQLLAVERDEPIMMHPDSPTGRIHHCKECLKED